MSIFLKNKTTNSFVLKTNDFSFRTRKGLSADRHSRYNTTRYTDPYLKSLVTYIRCSCLHTVEVSRILQSAAENLVCYFRLYDDDDWNTVAEGPKRYR